jgi:hypothetical protein
MLGSRLNYANVTATLALVFAVGTGTGVADNAVSAAKRLITGAQVKDNSLTGKDIKNGSVAAADLTPGLAQRGDTGPQGLKGDSGPQGQKGEPGPQGVKGDPGPQGETGQSGETGQPGQPGQPGEPGADGISPTVAWAEVDSGDLTLEDIPAENRAGIVGFSHEDAGFYCFDLAEDANVGAATAKYDAGSRFPRIDVPGSGFCPEGFRDGSVVFANTLEGSLDQGFSVIFYR